MKAFLGVLLMTAAVCIGLAGCGSDEAKLEKLGRQGAEYVREKYGFEPEVKKVTFRGGGDLVSPSQRKSAGYVTMEHDGRKFWVLVHSDEPDLDADNYMRDEIEADMTAYFKDALGCEAIYCKYLYDFINGQTKEVTKWQDMFTCGKYGSFEISIVTYGLDPAGISALDTSLFGSNTKIYISERTSASDVNDGNILSLRIMPEPEAGLKAYYYIHDGRTEMREYTDVSKNSDRWEEAP